MAIHAAKFNDRTDFSRITGLIRGSSVAAPHRIDFPWRLSVPALRDGRDARLWEDQNGTLLGFAAWQASWAALDFVVVAPDESLAGFCVCWLGDDGQAGQIEPFGVHPRFRRLGLSRAMLAECVRRRRDVGAHDAFVATEENRIPARRSYQAAGLHLDHVIVRKGRCL